MSLYGHSQQFDPTTPLIDRPGLEHEKSTESPIRHLPRIRSKKVIAIIVCVGSALLIMATLCVTQNHDLGHTLTSCLNDHGVSTVTRDSKAWTDAIAPWNELMRFNPAVVAVPRSIADIQAAVSCGTKHGVRVSAKGGGHSFGSNGLGGEDGHLVIDLQYMYDVVLHDNHTASIQPGARLGHVSVELYNQGRRAIPHGACPGVGIAGHVLYGGYGRASRSYGLTLDWLIGAQVILANGSMVHCSASENQDLFWALRGAGSSYGIVVAFEFDTFKAPECVTTFTIELPWSKEDVMSAIGAVQDLAMTAPQELNLLMFVTTASQVVQGAFFGNKDGLEEALQPLLTRLKTSISAMRSGGWLEGLEAFADGVDLDQTVPYTQQYTYYTSSLTTPALNDKQLESLATAMFANINDDAARHNWDIFFEMHGGPISAVAKVNTSGTAYPHRDKFLLWQFSDVGENGSLPEEAYAVIRDLQGSVTRLMADKEWGMYANFLDIRLDEKTAQKLYWGDNLPRLRAIKSKLDPENVFWGIQGVSPLD